MQGQKSEANSKGSWWDVLKTFLWAILIAMVFSSFVFQPFHIPSGSMKPTLLISDYLIVSKYPYGYSNNSFRIITPNIIKGRLWYKEPKRGDVIVFKVDNKEWGKDVYIKRVIGLPGDEIQVKDSIVYINGKKLKTEDDGEFYDRDYDKKIKRRVETLPDGVKHWTLEEMPGPIDKFYEVDADNTPVYKVPPEHFFMMGDNRDNSSDSRFGLGYVPAENLIGRAEIILFSGGESWSPLDWDYKRFFTLLR